MSLTIRDIADQLTAEVEGDASLEITGISGIYDAAVGDITFVANKRYASAAEQTKASAIIVPADWDRPCGGTMLRVADPDAAFGQIAKSFTPVAWKPEAGIHPSAIVSDQATLGKNISVGAYAVISRDVVVGDDCTIEAQCYIGAGVSLGSQVRLHPQVVIRERVEIGNSVIVHSGSVIGCDGFGYAVDADGVREKIPQVGTVVVGDDVEIGSNVTVDRARFGRTVIGKGVKIDNLVQIAHNVVIHDHAVIVAQVGISGSTIVGTKAILAGQVGVAGHLSIGAGAIVGAQGGVTKDVQPKTFVSGYPAMPHQEATRLQANLKKVAGMRAQIKDLEARLKNLENETASDGE